MPTDKPRITSYLDPALYKKLEEFQQSKRLKTLSKAVVAALEDYFSITEKQSAKNYKQALAELKQEIETIRNRLDFLSEKVEYLESESEKE